MKNNLNNLANKIIPVSDTNWAHYSHEYYYQSLVEFLSLGYIIFIIGLFGLIFNNKNFLLTLFSIELMYLGLTVLFIITSIITKDPKGQIYAILLLMTTAAESAVGLGILIALYRFGNSINFRDYQQLKG